MRSIQLLFCLTLLLTACTGHQIETDHASSITENVTAPSLNPATQGTLAAPKVEPPVAERVAHQLEEHGHVRTDHYYWLKEREDPAVIDYLQAENAYARSMMRHTEPLQDKLYQEIIGRIKEDDVTVPYLKDGYYYYTRTVEGGEYSLYCRKKGSLDAQEEIVLDANQLAEGHDFFSLGGRSVTSDGKLMAFATDTIGRRIYSIQFKDLVTGEMLPDHITDVTGNAVWAEDHKTLFYSKQDPQTLRSHRIYRHTLGTDPARDQLIYDEKDEEFSVWLSKSSSNRFLYIYSSHTLRSEVRVMDMDRPEQGFRVFLPRNGEHEYSVQHAGDSFWILSNRDAKNFRLMRAPLDASSFEQWQEVIPHRHDVSLTDFDVFKDFIVLAERKDGLVRLRIKPLDGSDEHYLDFGEPAYLAYASQNYTPDTTKLRFRYTSMTTPWSLFDYDMVTREKILLRETPVVGDFDRTAYRTERLMAPARDGKQIPVSLVYRQSAFRKNGSNPLLMSGYGSYGATYDPSFSSNRLSLLDRGFVVAIAHVRGGQMLGRQWYDDGKLLNKKNTFTDFIDVAEMLVDRGYTRPEHLFAEGGSAGGLLMGAIVNMRPDLFRGVHAAVPFVDVITTMMDPDIPLTTFEYDEWGNPANKDEYDYMLSYSPYDNVRAQAYPNLLVTTGLHDSQVQYWEPAKWVAKMRTLKTGDNLLLLETDMEAGHGGATGRFKRHRRTALTYAFMLDLAGIRN